ncbi:GTPase IMAP family member 8-like isoform X2 [Myxocyprinus asiaticus]|uniref:GTPase IMAP family member 8-like isoform X2 n=1 Tax=Myxocyprinus asiaticus TaxID=70543 RepID=UPI002222C3FC|nr:GTPase IMAP family member 8-like isoform X2 [Myxocyprinus asiaticus]
MQQDLRVVVLGWQKSEKATVINTILGGEVEPKKCFVKSVRRDSEVNGRKINLINTPCWWKMFGLQDSPEVVKQELVCSVFKCPPGPHVFLLVINLSLHFTQEHRISIEEHLGLFGERIWSYVIVLFTRTDSLKYDSIEQHIQSQGEDLQQIIQRCGDRYHIFDIKNKGNGVEELLVKIDSAVTVNNGKHFETDDEKLLEMKKKREEIQERAKARQTMVQEKRELLTEIKLRIVLAGWIVSGKSSTVNTIFDDEILKKGKTEQCTNHSGDVNGRRIMVMDTPGWWKYLSTKFNPEFVRTAILESEGLVERIKFPNAMILVIPTDTSFKNEQKRVIEEYMAIFGEEVWRHTIVLFTWGDRFSDISIEEHIESEGDALQRLIEKCGNRYHVFDNTDRKNRDQVTELLQKIDQMVAENCVFCLDTTAKYRDVESHLQRTDTQENVTMDEIKLKDVCHFLDEGFNRKAKDIREKIGNLWMYIMEENLDSASLDRLIEFQNQSPYTTEPQNVVPTPQQDCIPEQIKTLLERELSRWETIMIEEVRKHLLDIKSFELSKDEKRKMSIDAVVRLLQNCNHYASHTVKIQCPESVI